MNCHEMSKEELDMLILGQLDAHHSYRCTDSAKEEVSCVTERSQVAILYYFHGVHGCKKTYILSCMLLAPNDSKTLNMAHLSGA